MPRELPPGVHDPASLEPGDWYQTGWAVVTPDAISRFADLTGDSHAIHLSAEAARSHGFAGQVAHGLLVLSLVEGLKSQCPVQIGGFASVGWDMRFVAPVLGGDRIRARVTLTTRRKVGPDKVLLTLAITVENQTGAQVQRGETRLMAQTG